MYKEKHQARNGAPYARKTKHGMMVPQRATQAQPRYLHGSEELILDPHHAPSLLAPYLFLLMSRRCTTLVDPPRQWQLLIDEYCHGLGLSSVVMLSSYRDLVGISAYGHQSSLKQR